LAEKILKFKQQLGSVKLVPGDGGCFEVSVDGQVIHSKLASGKYPDPDKVLQAIRAVL